MHTFASPNTYISWHSQRQTISPVGHFRCIVVPIEYASVNYVRVCGCVRACAHAYGRVCSCRMLLMSTSLFGYRNLSKLFAFISIVTCVDIYYWTWFQYHIVSKPMLHLPRSADPFANLVDENIIRRSGSHIRFEVSYTISQLSWCKQNPTVG